MCWRHKLVFQMVHVFLQMGYGLIAIEETNGHANHILASEGLFPFHVVNSCPQAITINVILCGNEWVLYVIYASSIPTVRAFNLGVFDEHQPSYNDVVACIGRF